MLRGFEFTLFSFPQHFRPHFRSKRGYFHTFGHIFADFVATIPFQSHFERVFPKNVSISRFKLRFGRIFVQNALVFTVLWPFERVFPKNVSISRFKLYFGRIFVQNALVCAVWWPFERVFPQNALFLPLSAIRLVAAGTSSEKLCLSWAKLFHIPVPAAEFGHVFRRNALVLPHPLPVCYVPWVLNVTISQSFQSFATFWYPT